MRVKDLQVPIIAAMVLLAVIAVPTLSGFASCDHECEFSGFFLNSVDGFSYFAKMQQGAAGHWLYQLDYTDQPTQGAVLFGFYLFLGHVSRWLGASIPVVFFTSKLISALVLVFSLAFFTRGTFPGNRKVADSALVLALFGTGLKFLLAMVPVFSDFLYPLEQTPFLAAFTAPHLSLGIALMLILFRTGELIRLRWLDTCLRAVLGLALSIIAPFDLVVVILLLGTLFVFQFFTQYRRTIPAALPVFLRLVATGLPGGLCLVWQKWQISQDPVLKLWDSQNQLLSLPFYDYLLVFFPVFLMGLFAVPGMWRDRDNNSQGLLVMGWFLLAPLMFNLPLNVQNRFTVGYWVPASVMAVYTVRVVAPQEKRRKVIQWTVTAFSCLGSLLVLVLAGFSILQRTPITFLSRNEADAYRWVGENLGEEDVVLSAYTTGNRLPAYSQVRVVLGHNLETSNYEGEKAFVQAFFSGEMPLEDLQTRGVDYIFYGPRERELGTPAVMDGLEVVWWQGDVAVFRVP